MVRWLLQLGVWTLLGIFFASQTYFQYAYSRRPATWRQAMALALSEWYLWGLLAQVILRLARRFPITGRRWALGLAVHLPASVVFSILHLTLYVMMAPLTMGRYGSRELFQAFFPGKLHLGVLTYLGIVAVGHFADYYRRNRERELRATQMEANLAQTRLQALKMQLHPHFLFNTLHAVSALVHKDAEAADRTIARLSDLLRMTLDSAEIQEVSVRQELEFLKPYLEIEQTRFSDRLTVNQSIDPAVLDAMIPNLILQPIVENAIRHGIAVSPAAGRIEIQARPLGNKLEIRVVDNGPGLAEDAGTGVGLANTRARLECLYGQDGILRLENAAEGGLAVIMTVPLRRNPCAA